VWWDAEDAESADYVRSRSRRYPGGLDLEPDWATEVLQDPDLVAIEPDPKSRVGASRFVGWSPSATRVLVLIAFRDLDGDLHGSTPGPPQEQTWRSTRKEPTMSKRIDPTLASQIREESEQTKDAPLPDGATYTRPNRNRSQVYSVRLSSAEHAMVQQVADAKHLPASTLVRSWILERLDHERPA